VLYLNYRERQEQKSFKVAGGVEYVIGRSPNADLTLNDKKSSKRHAMIFSRDGRFFVRDLGSANKTFVNGDPIEESVLGPGDELRIGSAVFHASDERVSQDDQEFLLARTQLGLPSAELLAQIGAGAAQPAAPPRRSRLTLAVAGVVAALAIGAALYWLSTRDATAVDAVEAASAAMTVQVAPVIAKDLDAVVSSTGTIKAERTATVSSEVPGRVLEVAVDVGQRVERGQELARLNDRDVRLQIQEARSSLTPEQVAIARDDYDRKKRLFESGVVTRSMFDQSKNAYLSLESSFKSLQAKVGLLEEQLAKARVVAPMTGVVAQRMVAAGEVVGPGTPLFVVDAMDEVLLEAELSDRDIVKIQQGQQVEVTSDAFRGRSFAGRVEIIGSAANPVTKTFLVQARIPNTDLALRSGMIASMRIVLASSKGLVVPAEALIRPPAEGAAEVWVVSEGVVRRTPVRIGQQLDREVEVLEGLREGDLVVVYGKERLSDGAAVETYRERQPGS
jgi:RND family efflux transporter MFP subunit